VEPRRQVKRDEPVESKQVDRGALAWVLVICLGVVLVWYFGTHPRELLSVVGGTLLWLVISFPIAYIGTFFEDE